MSDSSRSRTTSHKLLLRTIQSAFTLLAKDFDDNRTDPKAKAVPQHTREPFQTIQVTKCIARLQPRTPQFPTALVVYVSMHHSEKNNRPVYRTNISVFAIRLTNPVDRERIKGTFPDGLLTLLDALPILRTGEVIVMGEASKLPMRYRVTLPPTLLQPKSLDPDVSKNWALDRKPEEGYDRVIASWHAQDSRTVAKETIIEQKTTTNKYENE